MSGFAAVCMSVTTSLWNHRIVDVHRKLHLEFWFQIADAGSDNCPHSTLAEIFTRSPTAILCCMLFSGTSEKAR